MEKMTVSELLKHLEDLNINTLLREIDEHIQSLLNDFEEDTGIRLMSQIQRLQNLAELLNHKRIHSVLSQTQNTGISEEKNSTGNNTKGKKVYQTSTVQHQNPITEIIDDYRKENFHSTIAEYTKQEAGDIHFAVSILPYKPRYIRELCRKGIIPHSRPTGKYVFIRSELEDWLKKNSSNDLSKFEIGKMGRK